MTETNLDEIKRLFHASPFITNLGLKLDSYGSGECQTTLILQEYHLQQDGYVHAGVQATVADHTAGAAAATLVQKGQYVLTAEFRLSLLRAAKGERLICKGKVLKSGKTLIVAEAEVFCGTTESSRLVSKATITVAVVEPRTD